MNGPLAIVSVILNFCFLYQYTHKLVPLKNMANDLEFATKSLKTIVIRPDLLGPDKTRNPSIQFNVITEDFKQKLDPKIPEISEESEKNTLGMDSEPILEEVQVVSEVVPELSGIIEVQEVSKTPEPLDTPEDRAVRRSQNLEGLFNEKILQLFPPPRSEGTITPRTSPTTSPVATALKEVHENSEEVEEVLFIDNVKEVLAVPEEEEMSDIQDKQVQAVTKKIQFAFRSSFYVLNFGSSSCPI